MKKSSKVATKKSKSQRSSRKIRTKAPTITAAPTQPVRTVEAIERRLWAVAQYRASDYGFAPNCLSIVRDLIRSGAQKIAADGFLNDEDRIALAEANLSRYISEMIFEAQRRGYNELHEDTENHARITLCPIWPFC